MTEVKTAHAWTVGDKALYSNGFCARDVTIVGDVNEFACIEVRTDRITGGFEDPTLVGVEWYANLCNLTPAMPEPTDPELAAQALKVLTDGGVQLMAMHGDTNPAIKSAALALNSVIVKAEKRDALIAEAQALHNGYRAVGSKDWADLGTEKQDRWIRAVQQGREHRAYVAQKAA